jgi:hypothetical protein
LTSKGSEGFSFAPLGLGYIIDASNPRAALRFALGYIISPFQG